MVTDLEPSNTFEPLIVAFTCQYCAYAAVDLAGTLHHPYPASLRLIRLPCSGKLDVIHLLKAFEKGADGVCLIACSEANCHHIDGSKRARRRIAYAQDLLKDMGIEPERLAMLTVSSAMDGGFSEAAQALVERIRALGPGPMRQARGEHSDDLP